MPFIRAISDTSPTSKLNVTFLQTCAMEPQCATSVRTLQPRTTDSGVQLPQRRHLRDVGGKRPGEPILAKQPAGAAIRARRRRHKTNRASATYKLAMDGIEETKAGNRPVSTFRVKFLPHDALRTPCSGTAGRTGAHLGFAH